jgi:hypothetical protein
MTGLFPARRFTASVTRAAMAGSWPNRMPPALTLGQEMLTSIAAMPSSAASTPASSANSAASWA